MNATEATTAEERAITEGVENKEEEVTGESLLGTVGGVIWGFCRGFSGECELLRVLLEDDEEMYFRGLGKRRRGRVLKQIRCIVLFLCVIIITM
jgi:hypothetical protein